MRFRPILFSSFGIVLVAASTAIHSAAVGPSIRVSKWSVIERFNIEPDSSSAIEIGIEMRNDNAEKAGENVVVELKAKSKGGTLRIRQRIDSVPPGRSYWGFKANHAFELKSCDYTDISLKVVSSPRLTSISSLPTSPVADLRLQYSGETFEVSPGVAGSGPAVVWVAMLLRDELRAVSTFSFVSAPATETEAVAVAGFSGDSVKVGATTGQYVAPLVAESVRGPAGSGCDTLADVPGRWTRFDGRRTRASSLSDP